MINLLPSTMKQDIKAARFNVLLIKFALVQLITIIFLAAISVVFYLVLMQIRTNSESMTGQNTNTEASNIGKQYEETRTKINSANILLSAGNPFADTLTSLASLTPEGAIVDSLTMNSDIYGKALDLKGKAADNSIVSKFSTNLEAAKDMFSSVKLKSTTTTGGEKAVYPVDFVISVTINKSGVPKS